MIDESDTDYRGIYPAACRIALVVVRRAGADRVLRDAGALLGVAAISGAGPQGESERAGMSLHAARREDDAVGGGTAANAVSLFVPDGLPDLQRLRDVAVQEDAVRSSQSGAGEMETRHAPDPVADLRNQCPATWLCAGAGR